MASNSEPVPYTNILTHTNPAKWIKFCLTKMNDGRKADVWAVMPLSEHSCLGHVGWYWAWRKYCFTPAERTVFEQDCLRDIADFCEASTKEYKARKRGSND